jgi:hypothetical protein
MEYITIKGFDFVKVGRFKLGLVPFEYESAKKKIQWKEPTLCELTDKNFINASCSTYIVTLGENCTEKEILYVGMFTETLNKRWFKNKKHEGCYVSWHSENLDDNINLLLKKLFKEPVGDKSWFVGKAGCSKAIDDIFENSMNLEQKINSTHDCDKEVSLWLIVDPFITVPSRMSINCSTSIEQMFLEDTKNLSLPFNKKGRNPTQGKTVKDIISKQIS